MVPELVEGRQVTPEVVTEECWASLHLHSTYSQNNSYHVDVGQPVRSRVNL